MKILIINTVRTEKNGITNVIFNYHKAINDKSFIFDFIAINDLDDTYIQYIERKGGKVFVLKRKNILSYILVLSKIIKREKYDAVHIHGNSHTLVIELLAAKIGGCKNRIVHAHSTSCLSIRVHEILKKPFDFLCTHRLACSQDAGHFMFGNNYFSVINNGIEVNKFCFDCQKRNSVRKALNIQDDVILLGHVGYFLALKNQKFIVDILYELINNGGRYKLLLIGDGILRTTVEQQVKELGLSDYVVFTGNIDNVVDYLNAIDVIVMPSLFEGLPLTLIEQQACGLQCVVADTITKEADITGNLDFLSLEAPIGEWAKRIEKSARGINRENRSKTAVEKITEAGYNITVEANKLQNVYESINKTL